MFVLRWPRAFAATAIGMLLLAGVGRNSSSVGSLLPLFRWAEAAIAAVDARIEAEDLLEEAIDDHDVRKHYSDVAELVENVARSKRRLPEEVVPGAGADRSTARGA